MTDLPVLPFGTPLEGQAAADWAVAILNELKAPVTNENVFSLAGWFLREGGGGQNNPMNTTLGDQYPAINSDGVRNYPSPDVGVQMTAQTLQSDYYTPVVAAFKAGVGLEHPDGATAEALRTWSGGGYTSITPVVVPMPEPVISYHYNRYDDTVIRLPHGRNSERNVVRNYDLQRLHLLKNVVSVGEIELNLRALEKRIRTNMAADPVNNERYHRQFRLEGVSARASGKVVNPS